jgi:hypothetical protein
MLVLQCVFDLSVLITVLCLIGYNIKRLSTTITYLRSRRNGQETPMLTVIHQLKYRLSLLVSCYGLIIMFYVCNFLMETFWALWTMEKQQKGGFSAEQIMVFHNLQKMLRFIVILGMSLLLSSVCDCYLNRTGNPQAVLEDFM